MKDFIGGLIGISGSIIFQLDKFILFVLKIAIVFGVVLGIRSGASLAHPDGHPYQRGIASPMVRN